MSNTTSKEVEARRPFFRRNPCDRISAKPWLKIRPQGAHPELQLHKVAGGGCVVGRPADLQDGEGVRTGQLDSGLREGRGRRKARGVFALTDLTVGRRIGDTFKLVLPINNHSPLGSTKMCHLWKLLGVCLPLRAFLAMPLASLAIHLAVCWSGKATIKGTAAGASRAGAAAGVTGATEVAAAGAGAGAAGALGSKLGSKRGRASRASSSLPKCGEETEVSSETAGAPLPLPLAFPLGLSSRDAPKIAGPDLKLGEASRGLVTSILVAMTTGSISKNYRTLQPRVISC